MSSRFFEGPEKKVELAVVDGFTSLRSLGDEHWRRVVRAAGADVLSVLRSEHIDAYLLSESSLFVYDGFVTMITCGQTTLVDAVDEMLTKIDCDAVAVLVYERKNEHFPHAQPATFFDDAQRLAALVPGRAVRFGCEHEHSIQMFHTTREHRPEPDDRTLEILMHGIDPKRAERFCQLDPDESIAFGLGLSRSLAGHAIDEHVFAPFGYSFNATRGMAYTTLHVTPQRIGSYVSFETNAAELSDDLLGLVTEVVEAFGPESFDIVVFEPSDAPMGIEVPGYVQRTQVREPVCGYHVTFQNFFRPSGSVRRAVEIPLG